MREQFGESGWCTDLDLTFEPLLARDDSEKQVALRSKVPIRAMQVLDYTTFMLSLPGIRTQEDLDSGGWSIRSVERDCDNNWFLVLGVGRLQNVSTIP